ncbi:class I SAM-dependent methyltransferase [Bradyrhizobium sediminis]|uniref:Class I SAM-dependent methyltransferase n=1 Tax=Bradyrhizobium sediminis TaxID=2840469 RepID=A0A975NHY9_9BRAD|nr:class I SAM-dependent methyltransferase [Bradyrhizobium sediminis]QWG14876.1 class I SAM-dependent methyltransferase [Bradyrhizobium sediminis]
MKKLELAYDRTNFWEDYWREHGIDYDEFRDLDMYPIRMTLRYVRPGQEILECGCGAGRVVRHLTKHNYNIVGLEYDGRIVNELKTCSPQLKIIEGDAADMPFDENSFDVSLCFGTVGTLHGKMAAAVQELRRVTRPGGKIVLSVMLDNSARRLQKLLNRITTRGEPEFYAWMDSEQGWRAYFESFGFSVIDSEPMVSRYNVYYWTPMLRAGEKTNLTLARVDDSAYRLNFLGRIFWQLHSTILRRSLAAATTFAMTNLK